MMIRSCFVLIAFLAIAANVAAQSPYPEDGPVVALNDANFAELVGENGREAWVIAFHADGCAPCAQMAPNFIKAAKSMAGIVNFGHVHIGEGTEQTAKAAGLTKVPTVVGFPAHKTINPYTKSSAKQGVEYKGSTGSNKKIADFAASILPDTLVKRIDSPEAYAAFRMEAGDLPISLLVSTKDTTSSLYKSLALRFRRRAAFAEVHHSVEPLLAALGVTEAPVLMAFPAEAESLDQGVKHEGEMKAGELAAFLESHAAPVPDDDAPEERDPRVENARAKGGGDDPDSSKDGKKKSKEDKSMFALISPKPEDFEEKVLKQEAVAMLLFTKLGNPECVKHSIAVAKSLFKLNGQVQMGEVNASDPKAESLTRKYAPIVLAEEAKCAEIVIFPHGAENKEDADPDVYAGDQTDSEALTEWIFEAVPDFVMPLKAKLVDNFLQQNPMKPKVVLFYKGEAPREYVALAANFQEDFMFSVVSSSDKANMERFQVTATPAIRLLYIAPPKEGESLGTNVQYSAAAYPAPDLVYVQMHQWLQQVQIQVLGKDIGQNAKPPKKEAKPVELVGTPEELDAECGKSGLCVVAFVSQEEGTKKEKDEAVIWEVAQEKSGKPFNFVYVDPAAQRSFASMFEVMGSDVPTVTVVSMRKNRYATYRKTFNAEGVGQFLDDVLAAKQRTQMIQEIPKLVPGGEEPEAPPEDLVEEEFDLSDIMGEEVEGEAAMSREELDKKIQKELEEEAAAAKEAEAAAAKEAAKKAKKAKKKKSKKKKSEL